MKVRATAKAEAELSARRDWWRRNRSKAPDLFDTELLAVLDQIRRAPSSFPVFTERRGRIVRRCLMPKTRCHLYIELLEESDEVLVLAVGGSQRRRAPRFRLQEGG